MALPTSFNFAQHLLTTNAHRASRTAYVDDAGSLSYGELDQTVRRCANALLSRGLRREERVLLLMLDSNDWPIAFLGCLYAGIVPVAVNTLLPAADYAYMLAHSRSQAVLVSSELLPTLRQALDSDRHEVKRVIVSTRSQRSGSAPPAHGPDALDGLLSPGDGHGIAVESFDALLASGSASSQAAPTAADDPAFWLYSSGSTGKPKGAVHTHANPWHTAQLFGNGLLGIGENDICFSAAKLYFAYGLGNALTFPLSAGATVVLMAERPTPDAVFKRWIEHQPTIFFGAPTGYAGMLASPSLPSREQVSLRMCSSAGEALPAELGRRFRDHFGCDIIDGIGSTEMLHVFLSNSPSDVRYGTTGKPVPGYRIELRGEDGRPVADGEIGDLFINGPSAALMYWGDRERSRETFQGAWTRSGDKYVRDADGYYTYSGRSDDMLKVSGQYVSPFEVEATLMRHPAVLECAVIGTADEHGLTRAKAFVVVKPGASVDADTLRQFAKSELAPHKAPRAFEFVDELPKTATGKIQRFRLRERDKQ